MKIFVDDIRLPPRLGGWYLIKNSADTIAYLDFAMRMGDSLCDPVTVLSLDHDLGGEDTSRPIVLWMCENEFWPVEVVAHSANAVGIDWLEGMVERYHPKNAHKYTR